jgi:hypothetical protein
VQPLLLHSYKDGRARFNAYLDDYANLIDALVTLYEADFDVPWLAEALQLADVLVDQFWDEAGGSFLFTGRDHERLVTRTRDAHDNATPSGNSMAATGLLRLGRLTGRTDLMAKAERTLESFAGLMSEQPMAVGQMLIAMELLLNDPVEVVFVPGKSADEAAAVLRLVRDRFWPNKVVASSLPVTTHYSLPARGDSDPLTTSPDAVVPLLTGKTAADGRATLYICKNYTCQAPLVGLEAVQQALG